MASTADYDWIFDAVMHFFNSSQWDTPVMNFIDEKCVSFEQEEENKFEYTLIHEEFRQLVDDTLSAFLHRLGVTEKAFFEACQQAQSSRSINQGVILQLQAMDDFLTFKKLMVKRNVSLQLESMQAVQSAGRKEGEGKKQTEDDDDDEDLEEALRQSLMELEMLKKVSFCMCLCL